ncbi:hypothetical protein LNKW23_23970 [Paralimibaculum aggregatum]|uniref:Histidine kinase/HSP90-like ATPase domain-containing protein n=1 Tax=Paralimibaculum aggregatum TaxID=3036245 RepID=A0ABQ6LLJ6_9RHOB|nr:ATP-binding protein [Limibaculum sp. NKW23]GMG83184.1 hypothetical protein LNKW23_23970 [Limibaculum sp. NKW23]
MSDGACDLRACAAVEITSELGCIGPAVERLFAPLAGRLEGEGAVAIRAEEMRLCLAEALNNCVEHGYRGMQGRPIRVELSLRGAWLAIRVADRGMPPPGRLLAGPPPADAAAPGQDAALASGNPAALPEGGWGWALIRHLADDVRLERRDGWNILTMERRLDR